MDWLREHLKSRLDRVFVVVAALCVPLALYLSSLKSYTALDPFGHVVRTRAHPRHGPFWKVLLTLLLVVVAARALVFAVRWVARGSARDATRP